MNIFGSTVLILALFLMMVARLCWTKKAEDLLMGAGLVLFAVGFAIYSISYCP